SFEVGEQEFVAILGPSGCGKTTLARILAGIETADRGDILLDGQPPGPPGVGRCLVFQNYGLLAWRSVEANVELGLELKGMSKAERAAEASKYIDLVGLKGFEKHFPHQVSGGMQQRVGLARALATQPRMLLMDEPFGALDAQMRTLLQDSLLRICETTRKAVLFVTHSVEEAVYLADRILIFSARPGRQVAEVTVDLPKPRYSYDARSDPKFTDIRKQVTQLLAEKTDYYEQRVPVHAD
ncbi:MAG: ABC transporter ATP-binding protein, partial [Chloroflexi bacterium]|nr:ABC transporter ATP-binding protein [Chloroflexota bacterium]